MNLMIEGGFVYDPLNGIDGEKIDLFVRKGKMVSIYVVKSNRPVIFVARTYLVKTKAQMKPANRKTINMPNMLVPVKKSLYALLTLTITSVPNRVLRL